MENVFFIKHHVTPCFSLYCVFSRADVLGGDAAPQGNVLRQARLLQGPAVTGRRTASPSNHSRLSHGSGFPPHPIISGNPPPSLPPSCECVFVWERRTMVVFNHHKGWKTDVCRHWFGVLVGFCWVWDQNISFFETCSTPIWHEHHHLNPSDELRA